MARFADEAPSRRPTLALAVLAAAALAQLALLARCGHAGGTGTPLPDIVRSDATGYTIFVSSGRLGQHIDASGKVSGLESLGFYGDQMENFQRVFETALRETRESGSLSCLPHFPVSVDHFGTVTPLELENWMLVVDISFVGRVQSTSPGWFNGKPATLLSVDIVDLLHVSDWDLEELTDVVVLVPAPELAVGGITLQACPSPWPAISEGDDLLFDIYYKMPPGVPRLPGHLVALDVLPIDDGIVRNPGFKHVIVREGLSVGEVSAAARQWRARHPQRTWKTRP